MLFLTELPAHWRHDRAGLADVMGVSNEICMAHGS